VSRDDRPVEADDEVGPGSAEAVAERVDRLVDVSVTSMRQGQMRRMLARARYAQDVVGLSVADPVGRFRVLLPDRPGLSVRSLADVVVVVSGLRRRFPWAAVQLVSFDDATALCGHAVSGFVQTPVLLEVHVHRDLVGVTSAGAAKGEASWLMEVVAHEVWHVVEDVFEATRYRESMEFRMALGRLLGLATFEHAYRAGPHASAQVQAAALERVREAVGEYATTSPTEGTAELFAAWWLGSAGSELVAAFGHLVDRYLPARRSPS
jgi:hypothetical protein